jgi:hypothetical protein
MAGGVPPEVEFRLLVSVVEGLERLRHDEGLEHLSAGGVDAKVLSAPYAQQIAQQAAVQEV